MKTADNVHSVVRTDLLGFGVGGGGGGGGGGDDPHLMHTTTCTSIE